MRMLVRVSYQNDNVSLDLYVDKQGSFQTQLTASRHAETVNIALKEYCTPSRLY